MRIGVDFDNTIVCYDALFHRVAGEQGLIPAGLPPGKNSVRDHLRAMGQEPRWTELQGYVYGRRMSEAEPYPGVLEFFRVCRERAVEVFIISHKTRYPYAGERCDLHAAAREWLEARGIWGSANALVPANAVYFEPNPTGKLERIRQTACTEFIDDLPEFLGHPGFPRGTRRLLFDPQDAFPAWSGADRFRSWAELTAHLFP
jgi:hypothetical protein